MSIQSAIDAKLKKTIDTDTKKQLAIDAKAIAEVVIRWHGDDALAVLIKAARIAKEWKEK